MPQLIFALATVTFAALPSGGPPLPGSLDLDLIRSLPVQHAGRYAPLDTLARITVESVTGETFFQGRDPVLMLLAWTFDRATWEEVPLINIGNAELRGELGLSADKEVFSYHELINHEPLSKLVEEALRVREKRDPLQAKVLDIENRLTTLHNVFRGQSIRLIPHPSDGLGQWFAIPVGMEEVSGGLQAVLTSWADVREAFLSDGASAFASACDRLSASLNALPAAHRPDGGLIATELRYNRLRPFRTAWIVMLVGAGLAAAAMIVRRKAFDAIAVLGLIAGFGLLTYGLLLRWQIAGRIPASNMFESLCFLSWGVGAFAIVAMVVMRDRIVPLTASGMGALALILADCLPIDSSIRPIPPVLMDTIWMSIHVPIIMVSYSVLALAVLIAHVQLIVMAVKSDRLRLADAIDSLHYWYVYVGSFLLIAGIITGSMWAASSWGRYWGWDPKEVWSLVAFLGYIVILHVRLDRTRTPWWAYGVAALLAAGLVFVLVYHLAPLSDHPFLIASPMAGAVLAVAVLVRARGQFATAVKSILAFWLVVMTYVGVNYVLGTGLHSYGFGTGAVVRYLSWAAGIDVAVIIACTAAYFTRLPPGEPEPA